MLCNSLNYAEILEAQKHLHELEYQHWLQYELFADQWWALVGVLVIPWFIWWKLVDETRTRIILAYGLYILFVVTAMDWLGVTMQLWIYPIKLLPIVPSILTLDWALLPVIHMLIYQYFPRWQSFLIAETICSVLLAFVGEPFAEWFGIYFVLHWYHIWSFPIYLLKTIFGKWLIENLVFRR